MSDTSLVFNLVGRDQGVNSLLARTAANVRASNLVARASVVALGAGMASAAAHAIALASATAKVAGAAGLIPAGIGVAAGMIGAARVVTGGLGEAWTATGAAARTGGGAAVSTAQRVAAATREVGVAQRALADAQRAARDTQEALSRARLTEAERLSDLSRSVAGARLDEESAAMAVRRAQDEVNAAYSASDWTRIREADLAYRQAEHTLAEVRDRVGDLTEEQAEGARKGVEGSDAVQQAARAQREAQREVTDATRRLADAQRAVAEASRGAGGGVDAAAAALARLSPSARSLVLTLRALAPAWAAAGRAGQEATWSGVAGEVRALSGIYLPALRGWLVRTAGGFNLALRETAAWARSAGTVRDVNTVMAATAAVTDRIGRAIRPLVAGFTDWAAVGAGFMPGFAGEALSIAQRFERWSAAVRASGQASRWMAQGVAVLRQLGAIAGNVLGSLRAVMRAGDNGGATLDWLVRGSAAMRVWLESAEGQRAVGQTLATLRSILAGVAQILPVAAQHGEDFRAGLNMTADTVAWLASHLDTLARWLPLIAAGFVIAKLAQVGANMAMVVGIPLRIAEMINTARSNAVLRAHTAALLSNTAASRGAAAATVLSTVATSAGDVAQKRSIASMIAARTAMLATAVATKIWAGAQWLMNIAMYANPLTWIIIAIVALIAVIVLIATKTTWFQTAWRWAWGGIKSAALAVGHWFSETLWKKWIVGAWNGIVAAGVRAYNWFHSLPARLRAAMGSVAGIITAPFRAGFNRIAGLWNGSVGRLRFQAPDWVPTIGGKGFSMPTLPMLAKGGDVTGAGAAIVGERGPELLQLPTGARVSPLAPAGGGRDGTTRIVLDLRINGRQIRELLIDYATQIGVSPASLLPAT